MKVGENCKIFVALLNRESLNELVRIEISLLADRSIAISLSFRINAYSFVFVTYRACIYIMHAFASTEKNLTEIELSSLRFILNCIITKVSIKSLS